MERYSIIITCVNETDSLELTIRILYEESDRYIKEIIIVFPERVKDETMITINQLCLKYKKIKKLKQSRPHVGGAVQDAFDICSADYIIMMASDLETDPYTVKPMIKEFEKDNSVDVVTASRWIDKGSFNGYGNIRILLNYTFNKVFAILYKTNLTDMTFGFRGFKRSLIREINWENYKHSFFFETIIKPILIGSNIVEVPTKWVARNDGNPQISRDYFTFIKIGFLNKFRKI